MYIFQFSYENASRNGIGSLEFGVEKDVVPKWNCFDFHDPEKALEYMRLLALVCSGCRDYLHHLPYDLTELIDPYDKPLQLEMVWVEHIARGGVIFEKPPRHSGLKITNEGEGKRLYARDTRLTDTPPYFPLSRWGSPSKHIVFAYGTVLQPHVGSDDFNFTDPFYLLRRFHSLFSSKVRSTDPVAFLQNLHYRGVQCGRHMPTQILQTLQELLQQYLKINTGDWLDKDVCFSQKWAHLSHEQKHLCLLVLDAARHLHDALPRHHNPLHFPGVMLLYRPDKYCLPEHWVHWIELLDTAFPAMQFVVAGPSLKEFLPETVLKKNLPSFPPFSQASPKSRSTSQTPGTLPPRTMLLVDVDSRLPNLALMKLANYYKQQGYHIRLAKKEIYEPGAEAVFASSIFNAPHSKKRLEKMQAYYGDSFHCGGSGIDLEKRLPREIEEVEPDYGMYPELQDRAIGFLTRGCPFHCPFCIVPIKEGKPRQVADLDTLTGSAKQKLILLDDNILAYPNCHELLQEMAAKKLQVNFNQSLDLSLVDKDIARLLKEIRCSNAKFSRTVYHFSLNDTQNFSTLKKNYALFDFRHKDNVEFICMYGFNTTLAQDVERFRFLYSLPGAYVFVQKYQTIVNGPEPQLQNFFSDQSQTDRDIDELIQICFTQNMKNMEKYYKWVSKLYAQQFGTLHMGLVDTIFRYNNRYDRGRYIASLAGTKPID